MTKAAFLLSFLILSNCVFSQVEISGSVTDKSNQPIIGAALFIEGTYDGGVTDVDGKFNFQTFEEGEIKMVVSYLGYETKNMVFEVVSGRGLNIQLRESAMSLDAVEISASTFKAGDNSKVAVLKPLDIVTTAGSMGDVIAAMQTLPGTQSNAEDGRLFIRGGEARETTIYIDGLKVFSPYTRTIGGTPSRGRYSPFLFKGVSFSTGGYSAAYGQALSGILDMNTIDDPKDTETNFSFMSVGGGIGHTQKWNNQSLSVNASYIDLAPYTWMVPSRADWVDPYSGFSGEAVYRYKTKNGLIKSYLAGDRMAFKLNTEDIDTGQEALIGINNSNIYSNTSYNGILSEQTSILAGVSLGYNRDNVNVDEDVSIQSDLEGLNARVALKTIVNDHFVLNYGIDFIHQKDKIHNQFLGHNDNGTIDRNLYGGFVESDYFFSKDLAIKTGLRVEYNSLLQTSTVDPRITLAQKLSKNGQLSAAFGRFTQEVDNRFLFYDANLAQEKSSHFLLNYNYKTEKQILRLEAYYKKYNNLLTYELEGDVESDFANNGDGRAYGFDVFYRANQIIKNVDFWVSYSWLDHERRYRQFPVTATPNFSTDHNLSLVSKIWMPTLKSQLGLTYNLASGRPYENPNTDGFLNERAKMFNSISMSWAYLISQQKILFISVSNITGFKNSFGYEYGNTLNSDGLYPGRIIRPNDDQFFFVGFFVTISPDKMKNQLDNL
ncbi:MAG: TonB-dependent receptor [Bacteroidota bacterium]